ncbi:LOW QUALITY PROTEIN: vitellogenin-like lipoprotein [Aphomia sociella]
MLKSLFLLIGTVTIAVAAPSSLQLLFPEHKQYIYVVKMTVSTGVSDSATYWTLDGRLTVTVANNFTRARLQFQDLKAPSFSKNEDSHQRSKEAENYLTEPWEVDFNDKGFVKYVYVGSDPVWATNVKRAMSLNFQLSKQMGSYVVHEPCLHHICTTIYTVSGNTVKKYINQKIKSSDTEFLWSSVPTASQFIGRSFPESMSTSERVYDVDTKGLVSLDLKGTLQYKLNNNILNVISELSLYYETYRPIPDSKKLALNKTSVIYQASDFSRPSNGIRKVTQSQLKTRTLEILLKIATKGIDTDNVVRNASLIHNLDLSIILNTIAQLDYDHLVLLFEDLILGTSYELETARNVFLEMLPHAKSNDCARFVKYLVTEKKEKIEDTAILSLIRKLPFNVAKYNQELLEELEVFTKLGLDFNAEIRRAGILSFGILVHKTRAAWSVKQDYMDYIVVKYFRMYSDCPQYFDRLIWLQGLCNIGFSALEYTNVIFGDTTKHTYERLWAAFGSSNCIPEEPYEIQKTALPILTNDNEPIQLRIAAVHMFLSSTTIRESDFLYIHNYIKNSTDNRLKSFWYSSVINMEKNKSFGGYRVASYYVPYIIKQVSEPDSVYWATQNTILSDDSGAAFQLITIGDESNVPSFIGAKVATGGVRSYQAAIYVVAQGVSTNIYKRVNSVNYMMGDLLKIKLQELNSWARKIPEEVHIDVVVKVQDMTVYAAHINRTQFDAWSGQDVISSVIDFLRLGSHINQQMIYLPAQMEVHLPSVLGIPIRLQSSSTSFSSIRGNLSATGNLVINNDLHVRYQGISMTSLSTDGLLSESEHTVRVQSSMVAYLPMKFNMTTSKEGITWSNAVGQKGGIAMHTRTQLSKQIDGELNVYTVTNNEEVETDAFSDCSHEDTGFDLLNKIFIFDNDNLRILNSIKQSLLFLKSMVQSSSPPPTSCGVPPPQRIGTDDKVLDIMVKILNTTDFWDSGLLVDLLSEIKLFSHENPEIVLFDLKAAVKFRVQDDNTSISYTMNGQQHGSPDWAICFEQKDYSQKSLDHDTTILPLKYEGYMVMKLDNKAKCSVDPTYMVKLAYIGTPSHLLDTKERQLSFEGVTKNVPLVTILSALNIEKAVTLLQNSELTNEQDLEFSGILKEKNGLVTVLVNNASEVQFKYPDFGWYLDSWSDIQIMKELGLYKECRLQESIVQTLHGTTEQLSSIKCEQSVVLSDCSIKPRFAIIRWSQGPLTVYSGDHYVEVRRDGPWYNSATVFDKYGANKFHIQQDEEVIKISAIETDIEVYVKFSEIVILMPSAYMTTACGECTGDILEPEEC